MGASTFNKDSAMSTRLQDVMEHWISTNPTNLMRSTSPSILAFVPLGYLQVEVELAVRDLFRTFGQLVVNLALLLYVSNLNFPLLTKRRKP